MTKADARPNTPAAAPLAADEAAREAAVLSRLMDLSLEMAEVFQARAVAAAKAGADDKAASAEAGFNRTALGLRRTIALKAKLRRQREEAAQQTDDRRRLQRLRSDDRRRAVAKGIGRAIAAVPDAEIRDHLTADLWMRVAEDERIDADRPDTLLPVETLVLLLGRELGLPRHGLTASLGPEAKAVPDRAVPQERERRFVGECEWSSAMPDPDTMEYTPGHYRTITAAELGLPGDEVFPFNITTGEVFDRNHKVFRRLSTGPEPPDTGPPADATAPPADAGPPEPAPPDEDPAEAEHRRRQAEARRFGLTLPDP